MFEDVKSITESIRRELGTNSSWGGDVRGALFDLSTNTYTPELRNDQGISETTNDRGVDSFEAPRQEIPEETPEPTNFIDGIIVIDGVAYNASIQGTIGNAV